ncbi:DMT family transporter [Saccharospirillum mangrovi]|uniref:DMT family transporter n=1 Tax=Saccharospirillum mangrovi TaxID=2161747 RepID=UPI0018E524D4|nr:DMT family transporter [Saccharospirillum mangrovi]
MPATPRLIGFTILALIAFAANSVLCRWALGDATIDAASFTAVRLVAGALTLLVLVKLTQRDLPIQRAVKAGSLRGALGLFAYAASFSFAYIQLDTATGALILFGTVQLTLIGVSLWQGHRLNGAEWLGVLLAFAGFVYLILPDLSSPSLRGLVLMMVAGVAWGIYTLNGRGSRQPLLDTAGNFVRTAPLVLLLFVPFIDAVQISREGFWLAVMSGALASGCGYALWYAVLPSLSGVQAGVLQLSVPLLAAAGGLVFVGEAVQPRLVLAALLLLGGIALVLWGRRQSA